MKRKAQEEMIGFGLIIMLVAVILLIFLGFALRSPQKETVEDYEVNSFIQAFLQYTTECQDNLEYISVRKLIFDCNENEMCLDGKSACEVLGTTLEGIMEESWRVGAEYPVKGYELIINSSEKELMKLEEGNKTKNYKGAMQDFSKSGVLIEISFNAYY